MEQDSSLRSFLTDSIKSIGLDLKDGQIDQFMIYLRQLTQWNQVTNLTSITDSKEIVIKHFVDSLLPLLGSEISYGAVIGDIGSGAGFPGLPIKIARPDIILNLIEPIQKKASFLSSMIGTLQLKSAAVYCGNIQKYKNDTNRCRMDVITLRALKLEEVEQSISGLINNNGKLLLYRSESLNSDQSGHYFILESEREFYLPYGYGSRVISVLRPSPP